GEERERRADPDEPVRGWSPARVVRGEESLREGQRHEHERDQPAHVDADLDAGDAPELHGPFHAPPPLICRATPAAPALASRPRGPRTARAPPAPPRHTSRTARRP